MFKYLLFAAFMAFGTLNAAAQQTESIVVLVKVFPAQGRENELHAQYTKRLEYLRKSEPDVSFKLHKSKKEPSIFLWYEVYPSQAAYDNHLKVVMANYRKEFGPTPEGILAKPSESEIYSPVE